MSNSNIQDEEEKQAAYYLSNMTGVGNKSLFRLLEHVRSAKDVMLLSEADVLGILDKRTAKAFLESRADKKEIMSLKRLKEEKGIDFIPYTAKNYPERLKHIPNPPFGLYVKGKLPKESKPAVAIIGARACSEYGKKVAGYFGRKLGAAGIPIISGMARGIDGIAQRGAIEGGGDSYAVLGCGADICYPEENRELYEELSKRGGILSEYLPGTEAKSSLFPPRNRIISGLADVLLVVEARKRSGTYITVMQALEQGKEVYAVPGRITDALSDGCNYLLMQGAGVALEPENLIEELMKRSYVNCKQEGQIYVKGKESIQNKSHILNTEEEEDNTMCRTILSCLDINPSNIDDIYIKLQKDCPINRTELLLELTKLQIAGSVIGEGNYYRLSCTL